MRYLVLTLALVPLALPAQTPHKCQSPQGEVTYTTGDCPQGDSQQRFLPRPEGKKAPGPAATGDAQGQDDQQQGKADGAATAQGANSGATLPKANGKPGLSITAGDGKAAKEAEKAPAQKPSEPPAADQPKPPEADGIFANAKRLIDDAKSAAALQTSRISNYLKEVNGSTDGDQATENKATNEKTAPQPDEKNTPGLLQRLGLSKGADCDEQKQSKDDFEKCSEAKKALQQELNTPDPEVCDSHKQSAKAFKQCLKGGA